MIFFLKNINFKILSLSIRSLRVEAILLILSFTFLTIIVKSIRWQFLIHKMTGKRISLWLSFKANLAGIAGGSFMPGRIDLVKPLMMKTSHSIRMSQSLSALTIERALDLLILLLIAAGSLFFIPAKNIINSNLIFGFIAVVLSVLLLLVFFPKVFQNITKKIIRTFPLPEKLRTKIDEFITFLFHGFTILRSKKFVSLVTFLSILAMVIEVIRLYFLMQFLGIPVSFYLVGFGFAVSVIIGVLALIPGGVGVTEFSLVGILAALLSTTSIDLINSAVLIDRFIAYYLLLFIGSVILIFYSKKR